MTCADTRATEVRLSNIIRYIDPFSPRAPTWAWGDIFFAGGPRNASAAALSFCRLHIADGFFDQVGLDQSRSDPGLIGTLRTPTLIDPPKGDRRDAPADAARSGAPCWMCAAFLCPAIGLPC
jgi:hypothetical protein